MPGGSGHSGQVGIWGEYTFASCETFNEEFSSMQNEEFCSMQFVKKPLMYL